MVYFCGQCLSCLDMREVKVVNGSLISKCCGETAFDDPDREMPASAAFYLTEMKDVAADDRHDRERDDR